MCEVPLSQWFSSFLIIDDLFSERLVHQLSNDKFKAYCLHLFISEHFESALCILRYLNEIIERTRKQIYSLK